MPIVETTYFPQYQWIKYNPFVILDSSVDMPNVEKFELSQRPFFTIFSQILFTYAQALKVNGRPPSHFRCTDTENSV
jgi:hypothetical protein